MMRQRIAGVAIDEGSMSVWATVMVSNDDARV